MNAILGNSDSYPYKISPEPMTISSWCSLQMIWCQCQAWISSPLKFTILFKTIFWILFVTMLKPVCNFHWGVSFWCIKKTFKIIVLSRWRTAMTVCVNYWYISNIGMTLHLHYILLMFRCYATNDFSHETHQHHVFILLYC